ncbi:hypothetical protein RFI_10194 [Reticulomyxa filosa]|uniref:Uncharacterized protein n=1 Tax=Reticulomyxa filosa TaxID=46433 RepID=X6NM05_RETFI|nr:hypothetical protein RFI_10194 [Reticulomyxa filosa]|eukprot:ETO26938.1 hypothetical protein RFI_10194 [Reticulomyxa filosa]
MAHFKNNITCEKSEEESSCKHLEQRLDDITTTANKKSEHCFSGGHWSWTAQKKKKRKENGHDQLNRRKSLTINNEKVVLQKQEEKTELSILDEEENENKSERALDDSVTQTQQAQEKIIRMMQDIIEHILRLRVVLRGLDMESVTEAEESQMENELNALQSKLMATNGEKDKFEKRLEELENVRSHVFELQNDHFQRLQVFRQREESILRKLQRIRSAKARSERIIAMESSHRLWAVTKLEFTLQCTQTHSQHLLNKMDKLTPVSPSAKDFELQLQSNGQFICDLNAFLDSLTKTTDHQQKITKQYQATIERLELDLATLRHDAHTFCRNTMEQIYQLHKSIQFVDDVDLPRDRPSVVRFSYITHT